MVEFIKDLIYKHGVSPSEIRAVTFSKEMATVLEKKIKIPGIASTFHSLGYLICSETERKPVEPELRYRLMCQLCKKWGLDYKELDHFIAKMRRSNITPTECIESGEYDYGYASAYVTYENSRAEQGWMDFDCQPPETQVTMANGETKRMDALQVGDSVLSWNRRNQAFRSRRVSGISRHAHYGKLVTVRCGNKKTRATRNHWFWVKFNEAAKNQYAVYLMWREGFGFRVGQCKFFSRGYSNWTTRMKHQVADKMWVLSVTTDYYEALTREAEVSVKYGIPQTVFVGARGYPTSEAINRIFLAADTQNGIRCLADYALQWDRPLIAKQAKMQQWTRKKGGFIKVSACNLLPHIMSLPDDGAITEIQRVPYTGDVYGLSVDIDHTYVADGLITGNSMLADAVQLLEKPDVRARWQPKFLVVDEAQDTDDCQWRMMQLMAAQHNNITVVGDPNQAIYGFRGAKPENITNFNQWFPGGRKYYLGKNYRSTQTIVKFVRENAPEDTPKELLDRMVAARAEKGAPIGLKMYWTDDAEAESALALAKKDPLNSIILARTNRMVGLLERLCNRHKVRYHLMGKTGFWKQNEIRKAIEAMKDYPNLSTEAAFNLALPDLEAKYAVADRTERDNDALDNLKVIRLIGKDFRTAREFTIYGNKMMHRRNDPKGVTISTVHQSKGGEWKNVFIIGANAKGFPHTKGDPKEEKRIYFVAISRAIDNLRISFSGTPSPYLRKYLTDEVLDKLREHAEEVDHLQEQHKLFV
jgi:superfamily I DNA/RNA helicase